MLRNKIFIGMIIVTRLWASQEPIDVVIPCHEKDIRTLNHVIAGAKQHIKNVRRIIVVSSARYTDQAEWFDEARYPFSKHDIFMLAYGGDQATLQDGARRVCWVYQQLLKLYAPLVIPDIAHNVVILDAETIFLHDVTFVDDQGYGLYCLAEGAFVKFFFHATKTLVPEIKNRFNPESGVCHHMLFQRSVMEHLFDNLKKRYNLEPWHAICSIIDKQKILFSEYELYVNYAFLVMKAKVKVRPLRFIEMPFNEKSLAEKRAQGYFFATCHEYLKASPSGL